MATKVDLEQIEFLLELEKAEQRKKLETKLLVALWEESNKCATEPAAWLLRARDKMEMAS